MHQIIGEMNKKNKIYGVKKYTHGCVYDVCACKIIFVVFFCAQKIKCIIIFVIFKYDTSYIIFHLIILSH